MHIKRLYIRDFGIYSNVDLDNISPGIVVLGGKNRAGKSTLLKLLRYFTYGFSKSSDLPNFRVEYEVEAQMFNGSEEYNVRTIGFSSPLITAVDREEVHKNNLYGEVDSFTYKEIFTISLDELQNVDKRNEKIQALLLGAGLKDIIKIPKLVAEMKKEAEKIGGKNGNPKTKLFKPNYLAINEGLQIKEKALLQAQEFKDQREKLNNIEENIKKIENLNINTVDNIFILEILKNNYEIYRQMDKLIIELEIKENKHIYDSLKNKNLSFQLLNNFKIDYTQIENEYNEAKVKFLQSVANNHNVAEAFELYGNNIRNMQLDISGLQEKIKNYNLIYEDCKNSKREINKDIIDINDQWKDNFHYILKVNTEEISFAQLCENIDEAKKINEDIETVNLKIKQLKQEKNVFDSRNIKTQSIRLNNSFVGYCLISLVFIMLGILIYRFNKIFGIIVSIVGIGGALFFSLINSRSYVEENSTGIEIDIKNITEEINAENKYLEGLNKRRHELDCIIEDYKINLSIDRQVPLNSIKDYFRLARDIKKRVMDLQYNLNNLKLMERDIRSNLNNMLKFIIGFSDVLDFSEESIGKDIISNSKYIFEAVKKLDTMVNNYKEFIKIESSKLQVEIRIRENLQLKELQGKDIDIISEIDKNIEYCKIYNKYKKDRDSYINLKRQLLHSLKLEKIKKLIVGNYENVNDIEIFAAFKNIIEDYINVDEIDRKINELNYELKDNVKVLEGLKDERLNIKENIKKLYNSEDISIALEKIDMGRRELKRSAEEYAVYNAAGFILEKLQKAFIDNAKENILGSAGDILSNITDGEFISVLPTEDLTKYDYKAYSNDGTLSETTDILSRGTKEQLFLAVRLSRIKDIKNKLPIVIDDSLVNFDYNHLNNITKILKELSKENQIFILTCHSDLVRLIDKEDKDAQFFKIEAGKFNETKGNLLSDYLS